MFNNSSFDPSPQSPRVTGLTRRVIHDSAGKLDGTAFDVPAIPLWSFASPTDNGGSVIKLSNKRWVRPCSILYSAYHHVHPETSTEFCRPIKVENRESEPLRARHSCDASCVRRFLVWRLLVFTLDPRSTFSSCAGRSSFATFRFER